MFWEIFKNVQFKYYTLNYTSIKQQCGLIWLNFLGIIIKDQ